MNQTAVKTTAEELMEIAPMVDSVILAKAQLHFGIHYSTINKYLKGKAPKKIFANNLLNFLREQIGE